MPLVTGQDAVAVIRPEKVTLVAEPGGTNCWPATVEHSVYLGPFTEHYTTLGTGQPFRVSTADDTRAYHGPGLWVSVARENVFVLPADDTRPVPAVPGAELAPSDAAP